MPGTVVRDAEAPNLLAGVTTTTAAGANQAGTAWEASWPDHIQFVLDITAKAGTTPTLSVDIQASESPTFAANTVVTLGTIVAVDAATPSTFALDAHVDARYVRAVSTVTGASGSYTATLRPVLPHDRRVRGSHPTSKVLA
jgi:hypothetical protein